MSPMRLLLGCALLAAAPALAQFDDPAGEALGPSGADRDILPDAAPPNTDAVINRELGLRRTLRLDDAPTERPARELDTPGEPADRGPFLERHDEGVRQPEFGSGG